MKAGDKVPVTIGGHVVAQATVRELADGTATLVVPATLVVMGVRTELTDLPREEPTTETVITGVDRVPNGESAAVGGTPAAPEQPKENATPPVDAAQPVDNPATVVDTPPVEQVNDTSSS